MVKRVEMPILERMQQAKPVKPSGRRHYVSEFINRNFLDRKRNNWSKRKP